MHDTDRIQGNRNSSQPPDALAILTRLERRVIRLERLLDEGIGSYLQYRYPHGDGRTDRWGRRR